MLVTNMLRVALVASVASVALAQDATRAELEELNWGNAAGAARSKLFLGRAEAVSEAGAAHLRAKLEADPCDLDTRLVLLHRELPELRRKRGLRSDPRPHGELVLGLIEHHPRSRLAGTAGFMLYPYKRDGMYTGPAWDAAIELWEELAAKHPKDAAIACNAGSFMIADPFLMQRDGPRALVHFSRARELEPEEPRWALSLGGYHVMSQIMTRDPEERSARAKVALPHLRAAWDLTSASERAQLELVGEPLAMVLASAAFDAGETETALSFATLALEAESTEKPRGDVVYEMNALLGRLALARKDIDGAARFLLAAGKTSGSPVLGSFGPDMTLAQELLAAGEDQVVRAFLVSCKVFWHSGAERLDAWIQSLDDGENPWG